MRCLVASLLARCSWRTGFAPACSGDFLACLFDFVSDLKDRKNAMTGDGDRLGSVLDTPSSNSEVTSWTKTSL